MKFSGLSDG